jgi:hypothetical protein
VVFITNAREGTAMRGLTTLTLLTGVILLTAGGPLMAEEMEVSGTTMYVPIQLEVTNLPDGKKLQRFNNRGFVVSDNGDPARSTTCWGSLILNSDGSYNSGAGFCHEVDPDGDSRFATLTFGGDVTPWRIVSGTGKFEGAKGEGTSGLKHRWEDGSFLVSWEGSWELR